MIKEKWIGIPLVVCGIILIIGGISLVWDYCESGETAWRLFRGVLMIIFAIGLAVLGIQRLQKPNQ